MFSCLKMYAQFQEEIILSQDGVDLYTKKAGEGPVCIFVHGGPGMWSKSFEDLGGNVLEKDLTMIYYDQRGSGRSGRANDYSIDSMIEDIEIIRKKFTSEKIYLIGHSFGGILITHYAQKYPKNVKGLIFLNATLNINTSLSSQIDYVNKLLNQNIPTDETDVLSNFVKARKLITEKNLEYTFLTMNKESAEKLDLIDKQKPNQNDFASNVFNYSEYLQNHSELTSDINIPVLIITGETDYAVGVNHYKLFKFLQKEIVKIDGGHILYFDKNEEFRDAIINFTCNNK